MSNTVKLTMSTTESNGQIRYTTDGTEPTYSSNLYSEDIDFEVGTTIKAKTFVEGKYPSVTTTFTNFEPNIYFEKVGSIDGMPSRKSFYTGGDYHLIFKKVGSYYILILCPFYVASKMLSDNDRVEYSNNIVKISKDLTNWYTIDSLESAKSSKYIFDIIYFKEKYYVFSTTCNYSGTSMGSTNCRVSVNEYTSLEKEAALNYGDKLISESIECYLMCNYSGSSTNTAYTYSYPLVVSESYVDNNELCISILSNRSRRSVSSSSTDTYSKDASICKIYTTDGVNWVNSALNINNQNDYHLCFVKKDGIYYVITGLKSTYGTQFLSDERSYSLSNAAGIRGHNNDYIVTSGNAIYTITPTPETITYSSSLVSNRVSPYIIKNNIIYELADTFEIYDFTKSLRYSISNFPNIAGGDIYYKTTVIEENNNSFLFLNKPQPNSSSIDIYRIYYNKYDQITSSVKTLSEEDLNSNLIKAQLSIVNNTKVIDEQSLNNLIDDQEII